LQDLGVDLNHININNIQDLNSLAQLTQSLGGLENLQELLESQVNKSDHSADEQQNDDMAAIFESLKGFQIDESILE
jgi:hypothetical protein